ncbi:Zn(2)-C6 fungal-type DNA-binding domain protein [Cordyceps fumosorosea ARSEF 2679]|uniref:Zn(2)-C6 fungal-type DNA-binding domain protein n=1 Tax=Cordyceps fumosorosea (strain ARSEF 2679) TaxID=1081104 RepID=A0A162LEC1_CORFA|nr:Zn(2)-C6 fungal-type DNA-binding domain protein [Cordyceps fumosorosea ARSEF 2679]OAA69434.1 Zn(2)-C6 fungal-type DNA-binding domain protein [Cordyceps fumosorosea ARSEF 2679]
MQAAQKGPKACTTCAKAKARCIPGNSDGDKCERCQRLNKDCFSRPPAPPRIKKRPKRSRVAELEKRLNELSSQVGQGHARLPTPEDAATSERATSSAKTVNSGDVQSDLVEIVNLQHWFPNSASSPGGAGAGKEKSVSPPRAGWEAEAFQHMDSIWPLPEDAAALLQDYHELWADTFPFIVVPRDMTSEDLRDKRPFLWKGMMLTASFFDAARQTRLGAELLGDMARAAVVEGVKTLDLLQGMQLLVAWYQYAVKGHQLTNLLFLARSMCVNLSSPSCDPLPSDARYSQLDPLRAYAATYYINTISICSVFATNKKTDVFMNTSHVELCLKTLESAAEYPSDVFLVKLVKSQQIAQNVALTMSFDPSHPMQLPIPVMVQTFQEQIKNFRETLPKHLEKDPSLGGHLLISEVLLTDIALSDQYCGPASMPVETRLELLWSCIRSLRAFFRNRFLNRDIDRPRYVNLTTSDIAYSLITSIKLLMLRLPGWDPKHVASELTITHVLHWQINDLALIIEKRRGESAATGTAGPAKVAPIAEDPWERLLRLLFNARELVNLQCHAGDMNATAAAAAAAAIPGMPGPPGSSQALLGELDESVWFDIVNETAWNMNDEIMSG